MADQGLESDILNNLLEEAAAVGQLAESESLFVSAYEAFRAEDRTAFEAALERARLIRRCHLVCEWIRIKECVLLCLELCGSPKAIESPDPRMLAEAIVKITADEKLVNQLANAVAKRDRAAFQRIVTAHKLRPICHFFCHWVCFVRYELVCRWLCDVQVAERPSFAAELQSAGKALGQLLERKELFDEAVAASNAGDAEKLSRVIDAAGLMEFCHFICFFFCSWRCVLVCQALCSRVKPVPIEDSLQEAFAFAKATQGLGKQPAELKRLSTAVGNEDNRTFAAIVGELKLERFCIQLCHWLCFVRCRWFCILICPPLKCKVTAPDGCTAEEVNTDIPALVVPVIGTAAGGGFSHYVLEWSIDTINWFTAKNGIPSFHYPPIPGGGTTQGNNPVVGGLLADFDTTVLDGGVYFLRLTVFSTTGAECVDQHQFSLLKKDVRILGVDDYLSLDTNEFDPAARFVETVPALCSRPTGTYEVSFGECISIQGAAFIGGCEDKKIKRYTIDYKPGFEIDPSTSGWINFWSVDYSTVWQYRDMNMRLDTSDLTAVWVTDCVIPFLGGCLLSEPQARLAPTCWPTRTGNCQLSGLITLRLGVEDTSSVWYYDTQRIWIDNKQLCANIRIDAVPKCADLLISQFATPPDCSVPWPLPISGIAYDEYIDDTLALTRPNDNFDFYWVKASKQGGSEIQLPVPGPGGTCFYGTSRVGDPGTTCDPCDPANPAPGATFGTLTTFDLRAVDPDCSPSVPYPVPANFLLPRGECCVYEFKVHVQDRTIFPGAPRWREWSWPVKICNDLPNP
jgi:hypothetical protein